MAKKIGILGLGRMGGAIAEHMVEVGVGTVVYNRNSAETDEMVQKGAIGAYNLQELVAKVKEDNDGPAIIWVMIKSGNPVDQVIFGTNEDGQVTEEHYLTKYLSQGDIIIDGGNSMYKDTIRRGKRLQELGIQFMDSGTSGGIAGARHGACLMIGGDKNAFDQIEWVFQTVAQEGGYGYMGNTGSGHYVKMVHNAIEYGMMQSIAEGLDLLENAAQESLGNTLDLREVLRVWNHGSIVRSYLTEVTENALRKDQHLDLIGDRVDDNGEGAWTILEAIQARIPFLTVAHALFMRYTTRKDESFAMKVVAAQRNEFGGHQVEQK